MARNANHVTDHNELVALLDAEAARFGYNKVSGGPFNENDPAHIEQHNLMVTDLQGLAALAGQSFTTALPPVANRGDAGHPKDHDAIRAALAEVAGWAAWNAASGGIEQSVGNYNGTGQRWMVHTFTGNGTFTVTRGTQPFRVLVVGGGGGGGGSNGAWGGGEGGGGGYNEELLSAALSEGAYAVTVGGGGGAACDQNNGGGGGTSSVAGVLSKGGGPGGARGGYSNNTPSNGATYQITGDAMPVGGKGGGGSNQQQGGSSSNKGGGGGGARNSGIQCGAAGKPGLVVLAYRIS